MTDEERLSIITQLSLMENVSEKVYENHTIEQLQERLEYHYGENN